MLPFFALEEDYSYEQALDEIETLGARSVSLFVTNYQEDIHAKMHVHQYVERIKQGQGVLIPAVTEQIYMPEDDPERCQCAQTIKKVYAR